MSNEPRDVSPRALSIARMIDRLGPGQHRIELKIDEFPGSPWELSVAKVTVATVVTKSMTTVSIDKEPVQM